MQFKSLNFFFLVFLALGLMALILFAQFFTSNATKALKNSNENAIITFAANNRLQKIVNLSFDLQSKISQVKTGIGEKRKKQLTDSLTMLGYNTTILVNEFKENPYAKMVDTLVLTQLSLSYDILAARPHQLDNTITLLADSLKRLQLGDKVYENCLKIQKLQENDFQNTLVANSEVAQKLSGFTAILVALAIMSIAILTTIIILHQSKQRVLIKELKEAEIAALDSKNAKEDFLANMSHEIRTPLNSLIGFSNLLQTSELLPQQKEYSEIIRSNAHTLLQLVNDVLDLSLIEAGKLKINKTSFKLKDLFTSLERMFSIAMAEKNLVFNWHIDDAIPEIITGDAERLKQIFINLIGNALKFTNKGFIRLQATLENYDSSNVGSTLIFSVKDTGVGIEEEQLSTIFERFEQIENSYTKNYGGAGLGLTIVKNLVQNMGGSISVSSQYGVGTEFRILCPFEKASTDMPLPQPIETPLFRFEGYKILIVEDNKANQLLLKHILEKYAATLVFVGEGAAAIHQLQKNTYDLILTDIQMPKMDGYTLFKKVREELQINTPAIAMTAYVTPAIINKCKDAGFDDYLPKPIDTNALIEKISKILPQRPVLQNRTHSQLRYLKQLIGEDTAVLQEILDEMKNQWTEDCRGLKTAVSSKNHEKILNILHRMVSTFSSLGPENSTYELFLKESKTLKMIPNPSLLDYDNFVSKINASLQDIFTINFKEQAL